MRWYLHLILFLFLGFAGEAYAVRIKFATLAPEGTSWVNSLRKLNAELREKTGGEVSFKIYAGGIMGDENVVLQKFRAGQLHAAAFTGIGLGQIEKTERILEMPFLFSNYEEIDYVLERVTPQLEGMFSEKGFTILGWTETGLVNFFSKKPITSLKSFQDVKMWAWNSDPMAKIMFEKFEITPVPLELTDVPMSLDTGIITATYATPLAALALQWAPRISYVTRQNLAFSSGALVISNQVLKRLKPDHQKILKELSRKYAGEITEQTRKENAQALEGFKKSGKTFVDFDPKELAAVREKSREIRKSLAGNFFSKELHNQVVQIRNAYRSENRKALENKIATLKKESKQNEKARAELDLLILRKSIYDSSKQDLI